MAYETIGIIAFLGSIFAAISALGIISIVIMAVVAIAVVWLFYKLLFGKIV